MCRAVLRLCARLAGARSPCGRETCVKKVPERQRSPREGPSAPPPVVPVVWLTARPEPITTRALCLQELVQGCPQHRLSLASQSSVCVGGGGGLSPSSLSSFVISDLTPGSRARGAEGKPLRQVVPPPPQCVGNLIRCRPALDHGGLLTPAQAPAPARAPAHNEGNSGKRQAGEEKRPARAGRAKPRLH